MQHVTCFSTGGTENGEGLIRHNQAPRLANGETEQRSGSSCVIVRKVMVHDNLKLAAAKAGVSTSHIIAVKYLN